MQRPPADPPVVRIGGPDRRPVGIALVLVAGALILAILKPWSVPPEPGLLPRATSIPAPTAIQAPSPGPASPRADIANEECYVGVSWRLFTVEMNAGRRMNTWYSMEPVEASGPGDATIPVVRIYSEDLLQLGYCTIFAPDGPRPIVSAEAWRLTPDGSAESISPLHLSQHAPDDPDVGVLYAPPSSSSGVPNTAWPPGRYVFVVRYGIRPADERWFGVEVRRISPAAGGSPLPADRRGSSRRSLRAQ